MKSRLLCVLALAPALTFAADAAKHINAAADVFNEIMATPDKGIPQDLLKKAQCIGIVPGLKRAGFVVGARNTGRAFWCAARRQGAGPDLR